MEIRMRMAVTPRRTLPTRLITLLTCFPLAATMYGQTVKPMIDPIIGTWKLNPTLTTASPGLPAPLPAQRTEEYRDAGSGQINLVVTTGNADGSATIMQLTFSSRGGLVTQENAPPGQLVIETRVAANEWRVTFLTNGVQVVTMQKVISPDGKTLRERLSGVT